MLQNNSRKPRRSINADAALPSLILMEKLASSNVIASCMAISQQLHAQVEGRKWCSESPFVNGCCWA